MPIIVIAVVAVVVFFYLRSLELFVLEIRDGVPKLIRGRIPGPLRVDFTEAVKQMKIPRCTIAAVKTSNGAMLRVSGMNDFHAQRLRNIFRLYSLSDLRSAAPPSRGTLLRLLGFSWLVWLFDRSVD